MAQVPYYFSAKFFIFYFIFFSFLMFLVLINKTSFNVFSPYKCSFQWPSCVSASATVNHMIKSFEDGSWELPIGNYL
jgi:hypothetical protein